MVHQLGHLTFVFVRGQSVAERKESVRLQLLMQGISPTADNEADVAGILHVPWVLKDDQTSSDNFSTVNTGFFQERATVHIIPDANNRGDEGWARREALSELRDAEAFFYRAAALAPAVPDAEAVSR
jgi:hypothetical protein